jgi:hypothetical protein
MQKILLSTAFFLAALAASPLMAATLNDTSTLVDQRDSSSITSDQPHFARVIDDLPLMEGLALVPEEDVLFVTPSAGRIAETTAEGMVDIDDVYHFYRDTLPHLGWEIVDGRTYKRDGDILRIDAHATGKVTTVHFSVRPNAAAR